MSFKKIDFKYFLNSILFFFLLISVSSVSSQTSEIEDFSRDEFIEKYEVQIHKSLYFPSSNEEMVSIYYLHNSAFIESTKKKNNIKESLQTIARQKKAKSYALEELKTNLNADEKEKYFLNKLAPDNFIVLMLENGEEELRFYQCIYD